MRGGPSKPEHVLVFLKFQRKQGQSQLPLNFLKESRDESIRAKETLPAHFLSPPTTRLFLKNLDALLADSFRFYRGHFRQLLNISVLFFLPVRSLHYVLDAFGYLPDSLLVYGLIVHRVKGSIAYVLISVLTMAGSFLAALLFLAAQNAYIEAAWRRQAMSSLGAYAKAWGLLRDYLRLFLVVNGKILLWSLCFVLPGCYFAFLYSLSYPAFFVDGKKGMAALEASSTAVRKHWRSYLLYGVVFIVLIALLYKLGDFLLANLLGVNEEGELRILPTIGELSFYVYSLNLLIFTTVFFNLFYKELRSN